MLTSLYIHNYKCFQNVTLNTENLRSLLLVGKSGVGKTGLMEVLGILQTMSNVEELKRCLGGVSFENIGMRLAAACPAVADADSPWCCEQLVHIFPRLSTFSKTWALFCIAMSKQKCQADIFSAPALRSSTDVF